MLKKNLLLSFFLLVPLVVFADNEDANQANALINKYFGSAITLQGDFAQYTLINNIKKESMEGKFFIEKPNKIRWHYMKPYEQIFLADGINFWTYDIDLEQATVKPQEEFLARSRFILFYDNKELMTEFEIAAVSLEEEIYTIILKPLKINESGNEIVLSFVKSTLSEIKLVDSLDQTIVISIRNLVLNNKIQAKIFDLDLPLSVDIIGAPLALVK